MRHRFSASSASLAAFAFALWLAATPAFAQGRLEAKYEASLAGVLVGKGAWLIDIAEDQYTLAAKGGSAGLLKFATTGGGTVTSQGRIVNGQFVPASYQTVYETDKKHETIKMSFAQGGIKEFSLVPEPPVHSERLPVTEAHKRNVVDPMTGSMLRVGGTADPVNRDACNAKFSVFDGRMRYDLHFDYKRMDVAKTEKGYRGPVVVCAIYFSPVSGYIPDRPTIKYLAAARNMEVWFAPIAGTRVLVPLKILVPTSYGTVALEATQFVSTAAQSKAAAKTQ